MSDDGFSGDGFLLLAERFRTFATRFSSVAEEAAVAVETQMRAELDTLYGQKLGHYWIVEHGASSDALMTITVRTEDVKVRGYEFGTQRHRIPRSGYARPTLHFDWKEGQAFFAFVEHPGTQAHNKRFELQDALNRHASEAWSQALSVALDEL